MLVQNKLGDAGARVVIEEFLDGEEASFIVMADGAHALPLATSQDHKRLQDGDHGPNTGGMGAYSPAPVVTPQLHARVMREIIQPAIAGMAKDGTPYTGFLYAGLMIDKAGNPKTLEFNCRLGDPETQPIMLRLKSDLLALVEHALAGTLDRAAADWDRRPALGVVLAAAGYPDEPRKGDEISGLPKGTDDCRVFHAGTKLDGKKVVTNGGRVLCVTALGDSLKMARARAYEAADAIRFDGMQYRKDIGHRALRDPAGAEEGLSVDTRPVRDYFTALQARIVAALERWTATPFAADSWERAEGGGGTTCVIEEGKLFERGGVEFLPRFGQQAAAERLGLAPAACRAALRGDGRVAGAASAQPVLPHGAHERALLRRRRHLVVRRRHGPHALLRLRGRREAFPRRLQARARAFRRRTAPALQEMVRRVFFPQAPQRAARHRRHLLRRPGGTRFRHRVFPHALGRRPFHHRLRADHRAPDAACPGASASATSSATGAGATWNSTWSTTAARSSACSPAAAPNPSSCPCRPPSPGATTGRRRQDRPKQSSTPTSWPRGLGLGHPLRRDRLAESVILSVPRGCNALILEFNFANESPERARIMDQGPARSVG